METIAEIYRRHAPNVLRRASFLLGNKDDAEDVLQDVFAKVVDKIGSFRGQCRLSTWLYVITTRACLDRIKIADRRAVLLSRARANSCGVTAESLESLAVLRSLLGRIPDELCEVAIAYYLEGMTHHEIAAALSCSRRRVGYLLERFHAQAASLLDLPGDSQTEPDHGNQSCGAESVS